ncbi:MAG TPA: PilN domain-containing protein [Burkholderiales bacterium]|nr:PilN domain-containing protein [Burkholderiales bacterium]
MIRRIELDYVARRPRSGSMLLYAGVLATVSTGVLHAGLSQRAEGWERAVQQAQHPAREGAATHDNRDERNRLARRIADANEAIGRLSLPWNELFLSVEGAAMDSVSLLSLQPQPQQRLVTLNGEARSYADVLEYIGRIDASPALSHARLLSHKVRKDDARHAVAFAIAATWKIGS